MAKVFISYSRHDVDFVQQLRDQLHVMGYETWLDIDDIPKGAAWDNSIDAGLKQSDIIVGVLSPDSVASDNVKNEWGWAITYHKPLLLLMRQPCEVPHRYVRLNYIDFTKNSEEGYVQLQRALTTVHPQQYDDNAPVPAPTVSWRTRLASPKWRFVLAIVLISLLGLLFVILFSSKVLPQLGPCSNDMVLVDNGYFWMGAAPNDSDAKSDEKPSKKVYLDAYCIDRMEVSNQEYAKYVRDTNIAPPPNWTGQQYPAGADQLPVERVLWESAQTYCSFNQKQLPTEAQWEKAARGVDLTDPRIYPWGNKPNPENANSAASLVNASTRVDSYPEGQSPYGVLNMAGNVAEWVQDYYESEWYSSMPDSNPTTPNISANGGMHVVRGGDYQAPFKNLRVSSRFGGYVAHVSAEILQGVGFRCASKVRN